MNKTVLYYTADTEDEILAGKVRQKILENMGSLPLISVSQKPLDFGENICVGVHVPCYANEMRQIQIGLEKIKTPFVQVCEADTLYPPEYFQFTPSEAGHNYRYDNVWVVYANRHMQVLPGYYFKGFSDTAQIVDRDMWLKRIKEAFAGRTELFTNGEPIPLPYGIQTEPGYTWTGSPVVTFKTPCAQRSSTSLVRGVAPKDDLPYWGSITSLREQYTR